MLKIQSMNVHPDTKEELFYIKKGSLEYNTPSDTFGFEIKIRNLLSDIWLNLLEKFRNCKFPSKRSLKWDFVVNVNVTDSLSNVFI